MYSYKLVKELTPSTSHTIRRQTALYGAFLWRQIDTVVELKKNWRAHEDPMFVALLERVRKGVAHRVPVPGVVLSDYDILKTRLLSHLKDHSPGEYEKFRDAPIVVTCKSLRDALNESKTRQFAVNTNQRFVLYHARDKVSGKCIRNDQQERLWQLTTTDTNDSLGRLPLIPGMPVMITENTATSHKVVNGSKGTLKSLKYEVDESGVRFAACAFVEIPGSALRIEGLDVLTIPIFPSAISFSYIGNGKKFTVRQTQLPLLPGWAFTDFKVQGGFLPKVVIDLSCAKSLQSIYVMLSWALQLDGIAILRWFSSRWLNSELQADTRTEMKRLTNLDEKTKLCYIERHRKTQSTSTNSTQEAVTTGSTASPPSHNSCLQSTILSHESSPNREISSAYSLESRRRRNIDSRDQLCFEGTADIV
ncbi:uncharacterized protein F5147DRAFT_586032 [Suillus discolor]|uniref:Uncharacterized protein n=1 Tax=Suillus discolor TaxID=1912936 RepID=A0A9P7JNK2_9AGAM|nr:uncharacterized protein F5147DRAFT_586032 [Suillus discolor]KAG2091993.1 hypothetical protein F5147DRAFT_586032 [Suillus discolor]